MKCVVPRAAVLVACCRSVAGVTNFLDVAARQNRYPQVPHQWPWSSEETRGVFPWARSSGANSTGASADSANASKWPRLRAPDFDPLNVTGNRKPAKASEQPGGNGIWPWSNGQEVTSNEKSWPPLVKSSSTLGPMGTTDTTTREPEWKIPEDHTKDRLHPQCKEPKEYKRTDYAGAFGPEKIYCCHTALQVVEDIKYRCQEECNDAHPCWKSMEKKYCPMYLRAYQKEARRLCGARPTTTTTTTTTTSTTTLTNETQDMRENNATFDVTLGNTNLSTTEDPLQWCYDMCASSIEEVNGPVPEVCDKIVDIVCRAFCQRAGMAGKFKPQYYDPPAEIRAISPAMFPSSAPAPGPWSPFPSPWSAPWPAPAPGPWSPAPGPWSPAPAPWSPASGLSPAPAGAPGGFHLFSPAAAPGAMVLPAVNPDSPAASPPTASSLLGWRKNLIGV